MCVRVSVRERKRERQTHTDGAAAQASFALNCCHKTNSCVSLARPLLPRLFYHMHPPALPHLIPTPPPSPPQGPLFDVSGVMQNRLRRLTSLRRRKRLRSSDSGANRNLLIDIGLAAPGLTQPKPKLGPLSLSPSPPPLSPFPCSPRLWQLHLALVCFAAGGLPRGARRFQTVSGVC